MKVIVPDTTITITLSPAEVAKIFGALHDLLNGETALKADMQGLVKFFEAIESVHWKTP